MKLTDWTRVGWESLQYAITHVATGAPFLERVRTLVRVAAKQQTESLLPGADPLRKRSFDRAQNRVFRAGGASDSQPGRTLERRRVSGWTPRRRDPSVRRIMNLSQTLEVFWVNRGREEAIEVARKRSGRWFDPDLVRAVESLAKEGLLWADIDQENRPSSRPWNWNRKSAAWKAGEETIEKICQAFAEIIDAKSPFTYRHSNGVADAATGISRNLGLSEDDVTFMRRAALVHDIGKLGVSNSILEKPGALSNYEWEVIKKHPYYTFEILRRIPGFEDLSEVAGAHHEKLDGSGYYRALKRGAAHAGDAHPDGGGYFRCARGQASVPRRDADRASFRNHAEIGAKGDRCPMPGRADATPFLYAI